jgi:predicted HicB family RNase H-like nuclease
MTALFKQCGFELSNKGVSPEIHSAIAMLAQRAGMSINAFIRQVLAKEVDLAY